MAYNGDVKRWAIKSRLQRLFTSYDTGWGPRDSIMAAKYVLPPLEDRRITLRLIRVPAEFSASALAMGLQGGNRESVEHRNLKRACREWMRAEGAADAREEQWCSVGKADVYSAAKDWIVEVGNTSVGKLQSSLLDEDNPRFTLVPFQELEWENGRPRRLLAVEFDCADGVREEIRAAHWAGMERAANALELHDARFDAPALSIAGGANV